VSRIRAAQQRAGKVPSSGGNDSGGSSGVCEALWRAARLCDRYLLAAAARRSGCGCEAGSSGVVSSGEPVLHCGSGGCALDLAALKEEIRRVVLRHDQAAPRHSCADGSGSQGDGRVTHGRAASKAPTGRASCKGQQHEQRQRRGERADVDGQPEQQQQLLPQQQAALGGATSQVIGVRTRGAGRLARPNAVVGAPPLAPVPADLPTVLIPVKACLLENDFTRITRIQERQAADDAEARARGRAAAREATRALLAAQLEEAAARRRSEAERRGREVREMDERIGKVRAEEEAEAVAAAARQAALRERLAGQAREVSSLGSSLRQLLAGSRSQVAICHGHIALE
jgi:hypothetical protein